MAQTSLSSFYQSEEGFKQIADLIALPIWMASPSGTLIWMNKSYRQVTGIDQDKVEPEDWARLGIFQDLERIQPAFRRHLQSGARWEDVFVMKCVGDERRWFLANAEPIRDERGKVIRWIGVNTEITKQKKTEKDLRVMEERYELVALASEDVIWDWNFATNKVQWSQAMASNLKHRLPHNITEIEWWDEHIHPEDKDRVVESIHAAIENHSNEWHAQYRFIKGDGNIAYISDRGYILFNEDKKPLRMVGSMSDVTWQKKAIERLKLAKKSAEESNSAKSEFLANVSHEVRTPLTAILGYLELMRSTDHDKESLEEFIQVIERNGQQVLRIIDDVLDLAKVEAGTLEIHKSAFPLDQLLKDMDEVMGAKAREKGISFSIHKMGELPAVLLSDPIRIRQIIINLVGNAIKFTEKGKVELEVDYQSPCLKLLVRDTGAGISQEMKENIFEPFNQGDTSVSRKYGGSGLGLALTKNLCKAMDGSLELVESKKGKGSVFRSVIVAQKANLDDYHNGKPKKDRALDLEGRKILVVDDSPEIRMLVQRLLGRVGAKVDAAATGDKAVSMALAEDYDLILLDLQMPDMDGYQTLYALRDADIQKPIVALTAHAMKQDRERALREGFNSFITKPMKIEEVVRVYSELSGNNLQASQPH